MEAKLFGIACASCVLVMLSFVGCQMHADRLNAETAAALAGKVSADEIQCLTLGATAVGEMRAIGQRACERARGR